MENNNTKNASEAKPCPREKANLLSYMTFWWTLPILFKGAKKSLELDDLYQPLSAHKSDTIGNKLCLAWENEIEKFITKGKAPSLLRAAINVFGWQIMQLGVILLLKELLLQ